MQSFFNSNLRYFFSTFRDGERELDHLKHIITEKKETQPNPCVWSARPFPGCQTQETLARDVFYLRGLESCGDLFFSNLRPLADSVCPPTFQYLCPVLKPAQTQDSRAQTNWARTNAGLTRTNGHSALDSAVPTHNYAPIVDRILQTQGQSIPRVFSLLGHLLGFKRQKSLRATLFLGAWFGIVWTMGNFFFGAATDSVCAWKLL
jgi:hypothetical protein